MLINNFESLNEEIFALLCPTWEGSSYYTMEHTYIVCTDLTISLQKTYV